MNTVFERRKSTRFPLEFEADVASQDNEGKKLEEKVVLEDISEGGAKFLTREGSRYFPGQLLTMKIHLPGTDEIKASMSARAIVVRVAQSGNSNENKLDYVAVKLETPLYFERNDPNA
jgi:c-di-GMP-binding flagellar brake protein YcgR